MELNSALVSCPLLHWTVILGGEGPQDALSRRSFFAKEPLHIGLFCAKCPIKIRHPMSLRHTVLHLRVGIPQDTHYACGS